MKTEELIERVSFTMTIPYTSYTLIKRLFESTQATVDSEDFSMEIKIAGKVPEANMTLLKSGADDIGQGRIGLIFNT